MTFAMKGILVIGITVFLAGLVIMACVLWDERKERKRENERINKTTSRS